jgi:hypothetical protein
MYGLRLRYLASMFLDAESIQANAKDVAGLMELFQDDQFLPVQAIENNIPRIGFRSVEGTRNLILSGKRFDYFHLPTKNNLDLGDFTVFCQYAISKLSIALDYFKRKGHRLAAIQEGLLPEMTDDEINNIAKNLLKFPPSFSKNIPFEWNWRCASSIKRTFGKLSEPTNTVITIIRGAFKVQSGKEIIDGLEYNKIRMDIDVNTSPINTNARFGAKDIKNFLEKSPIWHNKLEKELLSFMDKEQQSE